MDNTQAKILVEIAAYREPDLLNTVNSALVQADHPDRVFFAICYQGDDMKDYIALKKIKNCKIKYLRDTKTRGPCYARYLCQQLLRDEQYVFQVDAHMRFVKHWDTKMIEQLLSLNDQKATISFYPPNLEKDMDQLPVDDSIFNHPAPSTMNIAKKFHDEDYFIECDSRFIEQDQNQPARSPFIAAGNFFSFADVHREVLHDPEMCWYGDELPMSIRYYTHGWNNYCPSECYVYHKYYRENRAIPESYAESKIKEDKKLEQLLNLDHADHDLGEFGLGKERTLQQFEEYSGLDFAHKTVQEISQKSPNVV